MKIEYNIGQVYIEDKINSRKKFPDGEVQLFSCQHVYFINGEECYRDDDALLENWSVGGEL